MTNRTEFICWKESDGSLKFSKSIKKFSDTFIDFVRSEIDKNVHSMHCGFHTKTGRWDTLSFSKEEISGFHSRSYEAL